MCRHRTENSLTAARHSTAARTVSIAHTADRFPASQPVQNTKSNFRSLTETTLQANLYRALPVPADTRSRRRSHRSVKNTQTCRPRKCPTGTTTSFGHLLRRLRQPTAGRLQCNTDNEIVRTHTPHTSRNRFIPNDARSRQASGFRKMLPPGSNRRSAGQETGKGIRRQTGRAISVFPSWSLSGGN